MPEFSFSEIFPLGPDTTEYRLIGKDGVSEVTTPLGTFLKVEPEAITLLTQTAMRDIAHLLRTDHLKQLKMILDDPEASANDKFVALDLLKNASIAAGGVLPMCQDTGTAIVKGKKGQFVMTGGGDEEAIARGVFNTYQTSNLRYSQMAPITMYEEKNTGNNLLLKSKSQQSMVTHTSSCLWPRAAVPPTRVTCSKKQKRCSTRKHCFPGSLKK
jgi:fumarate hydratase class I